MLAIIFKLSRYPREEDVLTVRCTFFVLYELEKLTSFTSTPPLAESNITRTLNSSVSDHAQLLNLSLASFAVAAGFRGLRHRFRAVELGLGRPGLLRRCEVTRIVSNSYLICLHLTLFKWGLRFIIGHNNGRGVFDEKVEVNLLILYSTVCIGDDD